MTKTRLTSLLLTMLFAGFSFSLFGNPGDKSEPLTNLSINLKAKAVVLGPEIKLGDIGRVIIPDIDKREKIRSLVVGHAPPPGESSAIYLSHIKKCLLVNGFEKYISTISGPKTIRITTAHVEINKAFIKEDLV